MGSLSLFTTGKETELMLWGDVMSVGGVTDLTPPSHHFSFYLSLYLSLSLSLSLYLSVSGRGRSITALRCHRGKRGILTGNEDFWGEPIKTVHKGSRGVWFPRVHHTCAAAVWRVSLGGASAASAVTSGSSSPMGCTVEFRYRIERGASDPSHRALL